MEKLDSVFDDGWKTSIDYIKKIIEVLTNKFEAKHREYFLNTMEISIHRLSTRTKEFLSKDFPGYNPKWDYVVIDHLTEMIGFTEKRIFISTPSKGIFELDDFMKLLNKLKGY